MPRPQQGPHESDAQYDDRLYRWEIDIGTWCYRCGRLASVIAHNPPGHRRLCYACINLEASPGEVSSNQYLRCPRCRHQWDPLEDDDGLIRLEDAHAVTCPDCEHDFTITTVVTYTFTSPALEA